MIPRPLPVSVHLFFTLPILVFPSMFASCSCARCLTTLSRVVFRAI